MKQPVNSLNYQQLGTLLGGLAYLLLMLVAVWYLTKRVDSMPDGATPVRPN